jgi:LysM repeat protein
MTQARTVEVLHGDGSKETMDIDEYAKGVLPYEMSTGWPVEALKAQAVAAKSYALASGRVYTDTRSQVYGPLRYPDTTAAVEAVGGVYLAHQGQIIMPFFFGHCNGRTRSPSEAGWNAVADRPYLKGVSCGCGRKSYYGHGIGMCQRGAQAMAQQGATFDKILRHYYQGIELLGHDPAPARPTTPPANAVTYVVQRGDTLSGIAAKFGTTWQVLHRANADIIRDPNLIEVGWELVVPRLPEEEGEADFYVVQPGDTLFELAQQWGCSVDDIVRLNSISNPDLIRVGQRLRKPG